jgi:hypothetical protein
MRRLFTCIALAATLAVPSFASPIERGPHELYGFLLRQAPEAFSHQLGKPIKEGTAPNGKPFSAYHIPGTQTDYLVAEFSTLDGKTQAVTLELTGIEYKGQTGFCDLRLGDSADVVTKRLGKPTSIRHEDDVNVDLWDWPERNYSIEMSAKGTICSFQIVDPLTSPTGLGGLAEVKELRDAMSHADSLGSVNKMMRLLSGDVICTSEHENSFGADSARSVLQDKHSPLRNCLNSAAEALATVDLDKASVDIRLYTKGPSGTVVKLPTNCAVQEIVFDWEARGWRIYEITFRKRTLHSPPRSKYPPAEPGQTADKVLQKVLANR